MHEHYLDENANGDILICDPNGRVIQRFRGEQALQNALDWARQKSLALYANMSPIDILDQMRLWQRHRANLFRFLHLNTTHSSSNDRLFSDPLLNVEITALDDDDLFLFDDIDPWEYPPDVELAPRDPDDDSDHPSDDDSDHQTEST